MGIATISIHVLSLNCQQLRAENLKIIEHSQSIDSRQHLTSIVSNRCLRSSRSCEKQQVQTKKPPITGVISIALEVQPSISLSRVEWDIITEMNRARANPPAYEQVLLSWRSRFNGKKARLRKRVFIQTQEGTPAIDEAILFLRKTLPVTTLQLSRGLTLAARDLVRDQGFRGSTGHYGSDGSNPFQRIERYGKWQNIAGENIAYGPESAQAVVRDLIIDDGVPDRGHRVNMFQPRFRLTGVACGYHRQYRVMCDIQYAGGYIDR
jgi:uncharacterized protein YkwD